MFSSLACRSESRAAAAGAFRSICLTSLTIALVVSTQSISSLGVKSQSLKAENR
jgi:hypothetical protein